MFTKGRNQATEVEIRWAKIVAPFTDAVCFVDNAVRYGVVLHELIQLLAKVGYLESFRRYRKTKKYSPILMAL